MVQFAIKPSAALALLLAFQTLAKSSSSLNPDISGADEKQLCACAGDASATGAAGAIDATATQTAVADDPADVYFSADAAATNPDETIADSDSSKSAATAATAAGTAAACANGTASASAGDATADSKAGQVTKGKGKGKGKGDMNGGGGAGAKGMQQMKSGGGGMMAATANMPSSKSQKQDGGMKGTRARRSAHERRQAKIPITQPQASVLPDPQLDGQAGKKDHSQVVSGRCTTSQDCGGQQANLANVCCAMIADPAAPGQMTGVCSGSDRGVSTSATPAGTKLGCGFGDGLISSAANAGPALPFNSPADDPCPDE